VTAQRVDVLHLELLLWRDISWQSRGGKKATVTSEYNLLSFFFYDLILLLSL